MIKLLTESWGQRQTDSEDKKQQRRKRAEILVISCLHPEIDHHSLHGPALSQSHCAFTSVCSPDGLCSWSKSVIISLPPPLFFFYSLSSLPSLPCLRLHSTHLLPHSLVKSVSVAFLLSLFHLSLLAVSYHLHINQIL